jgi:hypothetical protein
MTNIFTNTLRNIRDRMNSNTSLTVSMLGPSGVGKTSLLATMYDQMENVITRADLQVAPDVQDAQILDEQIVRLKRLFATDGLKFDPSNGIQGNVDWRSFKFGLGRRGRRAALQLQFVDYPGGWIENTNEQGRLTWVLNLLRDSDAILIPIDAPALMERDGLWHRERNRPDLIFNLIQSAYEDLRAPRLIILAPIRCELYLNDRDFVKEMSERVQVGYDKLLAHLGYGDLANLIAVVIAPVQTLGEIIFHGSPKNRYHPVFMKTQPDAQYSPQDSEQPLRYLLRFAMRLHRDNRQGGYFSLIRTMFQNDQFLINATQTFANGCKADDPFVVLQGHDWLDVMVTRS